MHVSKITRILYDEFILDLEKSKPRYATDVDMRSDLPIEEQAPWYLADEDPPNKDA